MNNPRAEFLRSSVASSTSSGSWQYQRSCQRRQQRQERYKPRELPTHSISVFIPPPVVKKNVDIQHKQIQRISTTEESRQASGKRFALYEGTLPEYNAVTEQFVAMCSEKLWNEGWRPGFLLGSSRPPPEKYSDAKKMYDIYKKTGNLVYSYNGKKPVDKVKSAVNNYQHKNTSKKK